MQPMFRDYPRYSLCGLICGLCPMHHIDGPEQGCPGCGGEGHNRNCEIMHCANDHGGVQYCALCDDYPCERYRDLGPYDSFVPYSNVPANFERARADLDGFKAEIDEKVDILGHLLTRYNDGRRKSPFCTAVNLLPLKALRQAMAELAERDTPELSPKERGTLAMGILQQKADDLGVSIKLRREKKKK